MTTGYQQSTVIFPYSFCSESLALSFLFQICLGLLQNGIKRGMEFFEHLSCHLPRHALNSCLILRAWILIWKGKGKKKKKEKGKEKKKRKEKMGGARGPGAGRAHGHHCARCLHAAGLLSLPHSPSSLGGSVGCGLSSGAQTGGGGRVPRPDPGGQDAGRLALEVRREPLWDLDREDLMGFLEGMPT